MSTRELIIEGARQNNLKNINLRLPHDRVVAVTGVSGSGKSSLAFDTIFAEGQWRFIESLSTYARLFLEKLDRPDVDAINNIRPAIALDQKNSVRGSRPTVGTLTEIYDYLRLLYSKVSTPYCPRCGKEVRMWDTSQIFRHLARDHLGNRAMIIFESNESIDELRKRGYHRFLVKGEIVDIDEEPGSKIPTPIPVVLDRLVIRDEPRLSDSIETAWREGNERLKVILVSDGREEMRFSSSNACDECGIELPKPSPLLFSFNHPLGACPECKGFGNILIYDEDIIVPDKYLSLEEGAVEPWESPAYEWWKEQMLRGARRAGIDTERPYIELSKRDRKRVFEGGPEFYGVKDFFDELERKRYKLHVRVFLSRYRSAKTCPECSGKRLKREALSYKISNHDIADLCEMPISELTMFFKDLELSPYQRDVAREVLRQTGIKLSFLNRVGLDYITLSRQGRTLSGGEYQRVNLSNQLGSYLAGTMYVLDEPTIGLHARDAERVTEIMAELANRGNTIVVVEHDKQVIETADWVVELGPGGGQRGGDIVFSGPMERFLKEDTVTSRYIKGIEVITLPKRHPREERKELVLHGAKGNNLKGVDLRIPLQTLTTITGVSGSGKSSLIVETLYKALARQFAIELTFPLPYDSMKGMENIRGVRLIDQAPIGRSPRSNPVTYLKVFDHIRRLFSEEREARAQGYSPGFFSFNVPGGRCERCKGEGFEKVEMYFFEDIYVKCTECNGRRYGPDALKITYKGKGIHDILNMTVDEATELFSGTHAVFERLSLMRDVGLGYLLLGQPATTLSGGEAQRLKICSALSSVTRGGYLYILDEPTVGLHFRDVRLLMDILRRLVDAGNTVVVIEHNLDVVAASDWIIDLGPEGGEKGGRVIFDGTPKEIVKERKSYTGRYLKRHKSS
jgi:excinuclease ABC subunit A